VDFPAETKIVKIAAGEDFSMALAENGTENGKVYTFGSDGTGHKTHDQHKCSMI